MEQPDTTVTPAPPAQPEKPYWGFWLTVAFGMVIMNVWGLVQMFFTVGFILFQVVSVPMAGPEGMMQLFLDLMGNGLFFSVTTLVSGGIAVGLIFLFVRLKPGARLADYLAFKRMPKKQYIFAIAASVGIIAFQVVFDRVFETEGDSGLMRTLYEGSVVPALLWLAVVVAAPVFEEFFFRGFLFTGLVKTRLGAAGTIIITSLIWTGLHLQYGLYGMSVIFVMGVVMGLFRLKTGSIYGPLAIHVFNNLLAMVELAFWANIL